MKYKCKHYCIKKHIKGDKYENDCFMLDDKYQIKKWYYKESVEYECSRLNMRDKNVSYYYLRYYDGDILK